MNFALSQVELPMRVRFERPMSDKELLRFCAANELLRIERDSNGELIVMSPNNSEGSSFEVEVLLELGNWARADGRGKVFGSSAGFTLPDTSMRAPDASWISLKRWNALTGPQRRSFAPICPEFVIEIRSKSDRLKPLRARMQMWLDNGAQLAWLIDPERKIIEVYRPGEQPEIHDNPSSVQGSGPVRGFELVMANLWP
jgi:Uma2 family endonuclease